MAGEVLHVSRAIRLARILVAKDHPMSADALAMAVASIGSAIRTLMVSVLKHACTEFKRSRYDLLILEPGLTDSHGVGTAAIRGCCPDQRVRD